MRVPARESARAVELPGHLSWTGYTQGLPRNSTVASSLPSGTTAEWWSKTAEMTNTEAQLQVPGESCTYSIWKCFKVSMNRKAKASTPQNKENSSKNCLWQFIANYWLNSLKLPAIFLQMKLKHNSISPSGEGTQVFLLPKSIMATGWRYVTRSLSMLSWIANRKGYSRTLKTLGHSSAVWIFPNEMLTINYINTGFTGWGCHLKLNFSVF